MVLLLVFMQLTRDLFAIAKFLCYCNVVHVNWTYCLKLIKFNVYNTRTGYYVEVEYSALLRSVAQSWKMILWKSWIRRGKFLGKNVGTTTLLCDKVIGWQANASDADQIYSAIYSRAQKLKSSSAATSVTKQTSLPVGKDVQSTLLSASLVSAAEKRSSEHVADNDQTLADKRRRSVFLRMYSSSQIRL